MEKTSASNINSLGGNRLSWVDSLKGISILLVVFMHCLVLVYSIPFDLGVLKITKLDDYNFFFAKRLAPLRIPLFFLISGFLASSSVLKRSWSDVIHSKVLLYFYLYLLWNILYQAFLIFITAVNPEINYAEESVAKGISSITRDLLRGNSGLWYLYVLAIYFSVAKILSKWPLFLFFIAITLNICSEVMSFQFPYKNSSYCFLFFLIGVFFGKSIFSRINNATNTTHVILFIACTTTMLATHVFGGRLRLVESFIGIYLLSVLVMKAEKTIVPMAFFQYVGKNTLSIYILHRPIIDILSILLLSTIPLWSESVIHYHTFYTVMFPFIALMICIFGAVYFWKLTNRNIGSFLYNYRNT